MKRRKRKEEKHYWQKEKVIEKWTNLKLYSQKLGIVGIVDMLVKTEEGLKVVDIKNTAQKKLSPGYLYQTTAYALLSQEHFKKPVKSIIVYYTKNDKVFEIKVTDQIKEHTIWTIKRIKEIIEKAKMPKTRRKRQCKGCGYYHLCRGL
ncbi:MAG: CRISPR-associated protein Cas4 [Nitrososphaeria archaeon]